MSISPLDSGLHRGLLGDADVAALMDERAEIAAMIEAERALAIVEGRLGVIPIEAADAIASQLANLVIDPAELAQGVARDGVLAPALVAALRQRLPAAAAPWLHWGATSQDMADLSLLIRLKRVLDVLDQRLIGIIEQLIELAKRHRATICLAHTRMQAAAPTLLGYRVAQWLAPFIRHRERLAQLKPRLLAVQLGGATANHAALGTAGLAVMDALADALGLARAVPWHGARDRLEEFSCFLAMVANSAGKIGLDLALMAQSEVGEASFAGAGGSSTLPQKQNPVLAEILQSLARHASTLAGGMHHAGLHAQERDGAAWTLEWLTVPQLVVTTGASLLRCAEVLSALRINEGRMSANLEATNGLVLSEAAVFALAQFLPRPEATTLVKKAVAASLGDGQHLFDHLMRATPVSVDWRALRQPSGYLEPARLLMDRILAEAELSLQTR
jgi:3-carboxy-cis,cis-muconate cycloisomerase